MQENTIEDGKKNASKVNSQTDSNKLNSDISTAITPIPTKSDNPSTDNVENKPDTNEPNDSANEKMEQNEDNEQPDNSIYTKEELELSLFEMLEVTRINLECQLESNADNAELILKLIDTRKYLAF